METILHRQFREAQIRIDELDTENFHLQKRIEKLDKGSKLSTQTANH